MNRAACVGPANRQRAIGHGDDVEPLEIARSADFTTGDSAPV